MIEKVEKQEKEQEKGGLVIPQSIELVKEAMSVNIGVAGKLQAQDLPQVRVPAGGATIWRLETPAGEEYLDELKGVIIYHRTMRAYWAQEYTGAANPPDCVSDDGVYGHGSPGGNCLLCPNAQFGSAGAGQACKQTRLLYLLREGEALPIVVVVPPSSLASEVKYRVYLTMQGLPHYACVTSLKLERRTSAQGLTYAGIKFSLVERLEPTVVAQMREYREAFALSFSQVDFAKEVTEITRES